MAVLVFGGGAVGRGGHLVLTGLGDERLPGHPENGSCAFEVSYDLETLLSLFATTPFPTAPQPGPSTASCHTGSKLSKLLKLHQRLLKGQKKRKRLVEKGRECTMYGVIISLEGKL